MIKIDLITGFLGSGKTTFLRKYAQHLIDTGKRVGILENDYGAVNVDMMLLGDLEGDSCGLEAVAGACDQDCHRRRFKTKLIALAMCGYDRVLIEPSGIFDVDEFFDALYEEPLDRWYEIGNVIAIVDANLDENLSENSEYLLASQVANAGRIVLSKTQEATVDEINATVAHINRVMEKLHCRRRFGKDVLKKDWSALDDGDYDDLLTCGYASESYVKLLTTHDDAYQSLYFMNVALSADELKSRVEALLSDSACGTVFRVKGFVRGDGAWTELNATHKNIRLTPIAQGQEIIIVIGEALNEKKISKYFKINTNF